ncbi:PadR family transcriptional regulator [Chloroflexota bacterium]
MTNAELAILSLVAEQPRHGYEIEQVIEARGMRDWTAVGFSSIYYLLKKLEKADLITAEIAKSTRGLGRKVYHITPAGRAACKEAVQEALSTPQPCYSPFQLGLANLPTLTQEEVLAALHTYHTTLQEQLDQLTTKQEAQQPLPYFVDAMFDLSLAQIKTEADWVAGFIQQIIQESEGSL